MQDSPTPKTILNDSDFVLIDDVPLFHQIDDVTPDGEPFTWDKDKLGELVTFNNQRTASGELPSIHIGHPDRRRPADERESYGFIDRLKLGVRNGKDTIFARFKVFKDQADKLRKYPYRSVEINYDTMKIPAVALLGSGPACDLGLLYSNRNPVLTFDATSRNFRLTSLNTFADTGEAMVTDELEQAILEVLNKTKQFAWVNEQLENTELEGSDPAAADDTKEDAEMSQDADADKPTDELVSDEPADEPKAEDKPDDEDEEKKKDKTSGFSRVQQLERELAFSKNALEAVQKEALMARQQLHYSQRERHLIQLQQEGFDVNPETELSNTADYSEEQFGRHLETIKRLSKRAPIGFNFSASQLNTRKQPDGTLPPAEIKAVQDLATAKNLKWNDALAVYNTVQGV